MDLTRKNINALKPYVAGRSSEEVKQAFGLKSVIKLGSNENPLGTSPAAVKAMKKAIASGAVYPDGACRGLVEALSRHYRLPPGFFLPGNGSDEVLLMIAAAFLNPGEEVLVSSNTFSQYRCVSDIFSGKIRTVGLRDFKYDLEGFLRVVTKKTKLVFLCNPNNPTGTYFSGKALDHFLSKLPATCITVLDEAYAEFSEAPDFPDFRRLVKKSGRLIVCRTFSKIYGLAGLRLGYAVAQPELINSMSKVKNFNPFNINRPAQAGAVAALLDRDFFNATLRMTEEGRVFISSELQGLGLECLPSQANFICFKTGAPSQIFADNIARRGVIIRPLKSFGMDEWCRVTIGTGAQNRAFIRAVRSVLAE